MKILMWSMMTALAIAGTAGAQEPAAHEHEHGRPPAVADQKAPEDGAAKAEDTAMCACCRKDGDTSMPKTAMPNTSMQDMMKQRMKDQRRK